MLANLGGVVPAGFTVAVVEEATELFDLELPREAIDHTSRYIREVFQEGAQETRRAELDGEAQPVMVATMAANQSPVAVIQVKVAGQLLRRRFSCEATVPVPLLFGQETDGHAPPRLRGRHLQNLKVVQEGCGDSISADFRLQKYAAKATVYARTFCKPAGGVKR